MTARGRSGGYTMVELLMAITVFAIGVAGIIAMQKVTIASNQHAKNLAIATRIAQGWQEALTADAVGWNHPSPNKAVADLGSDTVWLNKVIGSNKLWFRPAYDNGRNLGAAFDALGTPLTDNQTGTARFCAHLRLSWLYQDLSGNGLLRAEVRVFWIRDGMGGTVDGAGICEITTDPNLVEAGGERYHFVHQATAIKQNTAKQ